jgi:twitching motility protein PilI
MAEAGGTVQGGVEPLLALLRSIEARCLAHAVGLPQQVVAEKTWEGVLFAVAGRLFVTPLGEVKEILNRPAAMTLVPGTRPWVVGVANIRGSLLPIVDLQLFLGHRQTVPGRRSRVLVIDHEGVYSGLLVDSMVGIRHFFLSERSSNPPDLPETLKKYVDTVYERGTEVWPVFSMHRLAASEEFHSAAA